MSYMIVLRFPPASCFVLTRYSSTSSSTWQVKKLLKQINELKTKGELNEDQQKKVDGEADLVAELKELEL